MALWRWPIRRAGAILCGQMVCGEMHTTLRREASSKKAERAGDDEFTIPQEADYDVYAATTCELLEQWKS